jgi:hypothetical protein
MSVGASHSHHFEPSPYDDPLQESTSMLPQLSPHAADSFSPHMFSEARPGPAPPFQHDHSLHSQECGMYGAPSAHFPDKATARQGMAAARSALAEMQRQGLTFQNIQELVQNMQHLLSMLRVRSAASPGQLDIHMCICDFNCSHMIQHCITIYV